jgi:Transcription factor WhiB
MIPTQGPRQAAGHDADLRSYQRGQARTRSQLPEPRVRPARPVTLQFSRGQIPPALAAACADQDPELWFSDSPQNIARAMAICQGCADRLPCLGGAMQRRETHGIWGGTDLNPDHHQEDVA